LSSWAKRRICATLRRTAEILRATTRSGWQIFINFMT